MLGIVLLDLFLHVFVGSTNGIVMILKPWVFRFIPSLFSFFIEDAMVPSLIKIMWCIVFLMWWTHRGDHKCVSRRWGLNVWDDLFI